MVPEGWKDATLGDLVRLQRGHDLPAQDRIQGKVDIIGGGGPNGTHSVARAPAPGIVIGRSGSGIGNAWWSDEPYWPLNTGLYVTDFLKNDPWFCFLWLDWIDFTRHNTGGAQPSLNRNFIYPIPIPLPPLPEQKKIAEILSTWDRAIDVAERQLDNAKRQKKALMQQLLTGTRRLPGFDGEWKVVKLGDVAEIIVSNVDKKTKEGEASVQLCNYMDVYRSDDIIATAKYMEATATEDQIVKYRLMVDDVIITKDSEDPKDIAIPAYVVSEAPNLICGYHLAILRPRVQLTGRFLKYLLETPLVKYYFASRANGATRFGLTLLSIRSAEFAAPSIPEQLAIADVLLSCEKELSVYSKKITHLRTEKRALMQQLLTGKRRVKV